MSEDAPGYTTDTISGVAVARALERIAASYERQTATIECLVPLIARLVTSMELKELRAFADAGFPTRPGAAPPDPNDPLFGIPEKERYRFEGLVGDGEGT